MDKVNVGFYGTNGHQILQELINHPLAQPVAVAGIAADKLPDALQQDDGLARHNTLDDLLKNDRVDLVSLCSPRRAEQAAEAIRCMQAGKHVYAEKPCAMTEADLDAIMKTAVETGMQFHEMAGTAFEQPFREMRRIVQSGILGTIVQILAQKSYPCGNGRPQDEHVDGGLLMQVGVHALRFVEHVAGCRVQTLHAWETQLGNPGSGDLRRATSMTGELANGGLATILANYLHMPGFGSWGNETLRIFGTKGFVEATDGGRRTLLMLEGDNRGPLQPAEPSLAYHDLFFAALRGGDPMPLSLEEELHPTRMVIRAKQQAALITATRTNA